MPKIIFVQAVKEKKPFKVKSGMIFQYIDTVQPEPYLVSVVGVNKDGNALYALINLASGNRYIDGLEKRSFESDLELWVSEGIFKQIEVESITIKEA